MSTSSTGSFGVNLQRRQRASRKPSGIEKINVDRYDAYSFALRAAYISHLLQPKLRRLQHTTVPQPQTQAGQSAASVRDLVQDFSRVQNAQTIKLPKGFIAELDKRLGDVVTGKERMPEFGDAAVKRTFAVFLNELRRPDFRRSMEADRKAEDLVLIFYSKALSQSMASGASGADEKQKLMVDRYLALFVRLVNTRLKSNSDWAREKAELIKRLQILETKLLRHDQDLSARNGGAGASIEVDVPRSQQVKDIPMALTLANTFGKFVAAVQSDLDAQKDYWTEKSALHDLKLYQKNLSLNSKRTLRLTDFESEEAYDAWYEIIANGPFQNR